MDRVSWNAQCNQDRMPSEKPSRCFLQPDHLAAIEWTKRRVKETLLSETFVLQGSQFLSGEGMWASWIKICGFHRKHRNMPAERTTTSSKAPVPKPNSSPGSSDKSASPAPSQTERFEVIAICGLLFGLPRHVASLKKLLFTRQMNGTKTAWEPSSQLRSDIFL